VPVVDIEAYVKRPVEVRRKEVEEGKFPGKVKRPMNSFMLYRKAYQNRTKNWCLQNNHQVVSQVCGESWPLEPASVRDQFNEWAKTERINHQNAHPGYKFSPSKAVTQKSTKRKASETPETVTEESDLDDFDWQEGGTKKEKKQKRDTATPTESERYSTSSPYYPQEIPEHFQFDRSQSSSYAPASSYGLNNPGKPYPAQYNQANLRNAQYYERMVRKNTSHPGQVEDVLIRVADAPGNHHYHSLPGGPTYVIMDPYQSQEESLTPEHKIDPSLVAQDDGLFDEGYPNEGSMYLGGSFDADPRWTGQYDVLDPGLYEENHGHGIEPPNFNDMQLQDQNLQILKGSRDPWSVEPLDAGHEYDKWMDEA
jgi:hypothetical protein